MDSTDPGTQRRADLCHAGGCPGGTGASWSAPTVTGTSTTIRDLAAGDESSSQTIDGAWRFPTVGMDPTPVGVSDDGRRSCSSRRASPPPARRASRSRPDAVATPRFVELAGEFEYDALSPDGSILYVVEHLAGPPDGHYQVRAVDTATGCCARGRRRQERGRRGDGRLADRPGPATRRHGLHSLPWRGAPVHPRAEQRRCLGVVHRPAGDRADDTPRPPTGGSPRPSTGVRSSPRTRRSAWPSTSRCPISRSAERVLHPVGIERISWPSSATTREAWSGAGSSPRPTGR